MLHRHHVPDEPGSRRLRYFIECAALLEQVGRARNDAEFLLALQALQGLLIEFDHQTPVGLRNLYPAGVPYREHIHSVVRTPNGNDYGKDLLRQHYQQHKH